MQLIDTTDFVYAASFIICHRPLAEYGYVQLYATSIVHEPEKPTGNKVTVLDHPSHPPTGLPSHSACQHYLGKPPAQHNRPPMQQTALVASPELSWTWLHRTAKSTRSTSRSLLKETSRRRRWKVCTSGQQAVLTRRTSQQ
jgi:hypothetical protein